ncbi:MAG: sensor histidine kinase [Bacillota bacterium]|nr:sensor histidine kinase [Bacillota bacterium]MDW7683377.1 sensor histidine kinase [Bacillota bacterium]
MISNFFAENMLIMHVIYALLFFLYSFAIVLKLNRRSELNLARSFWLLSVYGFLFGVNQLLTITLYTKGAELSEYTQYVLWNLDLFLRAFAFMVILWLGIRLVAGVVDRARPLYWAGLAVSLVWLLMALYSLGFLNYSSYLGVMDNLSRYMFSIPGLLLTGYGLLLHTSEIEKFRIPSLVKHVKGLAYTFFAGVFFIGMIATHPVLWPAVILNQNTFTMVTGIPVVFFRSVYLVIVTYFVVKIVNVFEVEREFRLEEALRRQVLAEERDRIARELHDGIIQSIYGVGLKLKQHGILIKKKPEEANRQMDMAKSDLDNIIQDLRDYIEELHLDDYSSVSLKEAMADLVERFRAYAVMKVDYSVSGRQTGELNIVQVNHIVQIVRELLANAAKHSRASLVRLRLTFMENSLAIHFSDDGVGFDPEKLDLVKHAAQRKGLENIFNRVTMLQGSIVFHSAPNQGTYFELKFPYSKLNYLRTAFIKDVDYFGLGKPDTE